MLVVFINQIPNYIYMLICFSQTIFIDWHFLHYSLYNITAC